MAKSTKKTGTGTKPATRKTTTKTTTTTRNATVPKTRAAADIQLTADQIRQRAYEIYLRRNGGPGDQTSDWVQAEQELRRELAR